MDSHCFALFVFATVTLLTTFVSARAVNISNTWMLPEEGFPVFYRHFRDRISWYEADAVCQFHHANLVTADSSSQYDAIRAYLKELDITENVWIGLSKTTERPNFTWTDFRPLSGDGHWQQSIPQGSEALCVGMDPAADFLWKPMTCGGPEVASFICELPVPSWAMGPRGCLLTELPSLTVLYIPEQLALELTSDCGFDGTKRIACKGNANREEILKQLTCALSPDDFEDKSTKAPVAASTILSEISSEDSSFSSKTTKPWIWTSNTIDIDYGMPTRHRRETEYTLNPASTKSTTDLSVHESRGKNKLTTADYDTDSTSVSPERDVTLDSSVSWKFDKSEIKTTQVTDLSTQDVNTQPEEQGEMSGSAAVTAESKGPESGGEDTGEYPSAIGQGQLFSIIENGTMFDIIELNETSDDLKLAKDIVMETPQSEKVTLKLSTSRSNTEHSDDLYTTVVYHKEPPSETTFVTNKSVKKDKHSKKQTIKEKDPKKLRQRMTDKFLHYHNFNSPDNKRDDKTLSKEVEMFPIMTDSLIKLNRTHRKELPQNEDESVEVNTLKIPKILDVMNNDNQKHIELKWQKGGNTNSTRTQFFITTKRMDVPKKGPGNSASKANLELEDDQEIFHKIDAKIELLNSNNTTENNESEIFVPPKPEKVKTIPEESMKKQFLPKSLLGKSKVDTSSEAPSNEPLEPEPQAQPRPNRQRQLTRPQRRSFYPYFFSRVLG